MESLRSGSNPPPALGAVQASVQCTVAFAISYNHEYSQFIHECTIAVMNTTLSRMRQLIHKGQVGDTQLLYMILNTCLIVAHPAATTSPLWLPYLAVTVAITLNKKGILEYTQSWRWRREPIRIFGGDGHTIAIEKAQCSGAPNQLSTS